ncbi:MAG: transcriptional regulator, partial [Nitrosopumilus sp.]
KEKLQKVSEYIDEENSGITELANKRKQVEDEADQVGVIISNLRDKLLGVDKIIEDEGNRVKKIKELRDSFEN